MSGKSLVFLVALLILGISALTISMTFLLVGTDGMFPRITRFALTAALCYYLYKGRSWVRWLTIVLLGLGVAIGFSNLGQTFSVSVLGGAISALMIVAHISCIAILLLPRAVRDYFSNSEYDQ